MLESAFRTPLSGQSRLHASLPLLSSGLCSPVPLWAYLQLAANLIKCVLTPYEQNHYAAHNAQGYLNVKMVELNDVFIGNQSNLPEDSTLSLIIYTQNGVTLHTLLFAQAIEKKSFFGHQLIWPPSKSTRAWVF